MAVSKTSGAAVPVKKTAAKPKAAPAQAGEQPNAEQADKLSPATEVAASGAIIEPEIVDRIDTSHPAVDSNPREGTSVASNQIDFNDPTKSPEEAVEENLRAAEGSASKD